MFLFLFLPSVTQGAILLEENNGAHCLDFTEEPGYYIKPYTYEQDPSPKRVKFVFENIAYDAEEEIKEVDLGIKLEAESFVQRHKLKTSLYTEARLLPMKNKLIFYLEIWFDISNQCSLINLRLNLQICNYPDFSGFVIARVVPTIHLIKHIAASRSIKVIPKNDKLHVQDLEIFQPLTEFTCSTDIEIVMFSYKLKRKNLTDATVSKTRLTETTLLPVVTTLDYRSTFDECSGLERLRLKVSTKIKGADEVNILTKNVERLVPIFTICLTNGSYILEDQGLERFWKCFPSAEIPDKVKLTKQDGKFHINSSVYCDNPFDSILIGNANTIVIGDLQDIELQYDLDKNEIVLHQAGAFVNCRQILLSLQCYQGDQRQQTIHQVLFKDQLAPADNFQGKYCRITRPKSGYVYIGYAMSSLQLALLVSGTIGVFLGLSFIISLTMYIIKRRRSKLGNETENISYPIQEKEQPQQLEELQENFKAINVRRVADTADTDEYYTSIDINAEIFKSKKSKSRHR